MLPIVRGGPRIMILKGEREELDRVLAEAFPVALHTFQSAIDAAGEGQTIVALHGDGERGRREYRVLPSSSDDVLAVLLNRAAGILDSVRLLPRILFFRIIGDSERVLEQMEADLDEGVIPDAVVKRGRLRSLLGVHRSNEIAICFTRASLRGPVAVSDFMDEVLLVDGVFYHDLYAFLRNRALWFFTEGLENRTWNEMEIRVYDTWGYYMDHVKRLRTVLDSLEIGMILGEGWGKDFGHILIPVRVYRLRLFSFLSPEQVKEILVGLEYAEDGDRLVDYDLYHGKDKISWGGMKRERGPRDQIGKTAREKLFSSLKSNDRELLQKLEERVVTLRKSRETGG
ncbi:MAG: hypothetical protein GX181_05470 [Synergistaceae bacterium]|nr:hypothetical protein [Synergistota bacterium]NLM71390.1 hypothetical protein [Synergistaceae bacterium]